MRYLLGIIMCAFLLASATAADAPSYGRVIYIQTQDKKPGGPIDIYEKDLDTGKTNLLIQHDSLPKELQASISSLIMSPNGKYLIIGQPVHSKLTIKEVFGEDVPISNKNVGDQYVDVYVGDNYWLWKRGSNGLKQIMKESDWYEEKLWSPSSRYFMAFDYSESRIWIYDVNADSLRKLGPLQDVSTVAWTAKQDGIIAAADSKPEGSTVYLLPLGKEKRKVLFKWPGGIQSIAQSPDSTCYAIFDGIKVSLFEPKTNRTRKMSVSVEEEAMFDVNFLFNNTGRKLAAFTTYTYGEPHVNWEDKLWSVDVKLGVSLRIALWDETYLRISPTEGSATQRQLIGWSSDGRSVLLAGQVMWGGEGAVENRDDQHDLYAYDTTKRKDNEKELFTSGPGCLGLTWSASSSQQPATSIR